MGNMNNKRKSTMALSGRQKLIIQMLVQMNSRPVTVAAVSEKLGVSSRTVLREIPQIEKWLEENDFHFIRKTGVGLQIQESPEHLELISELLEIENVIPLYSRDERRRRLLGELLFESEPMKSFVFTSKYDISEGTLFSDLDFLSIWLEKYQVNIIRRPGMGIFLEGNEADIRQAAVNAVFDFYDMSQVAGLLSTNQEQQSQVQKPLLIFLRPEITTFVKEILEESKKQLNVRYMDSGVISLHIRISMAIYRIQSGCTIKVFSQETQRMQGSREYEVAEYIGREITRVFGVEVNEHEIGYLAFFLSSARIWSNVSLFSDPMQSMNVRQVAMSMTSIVEQLTGLPFRSNGEMIDDLVSHIAAMEQQGSMDMFSESSQIDPVRQSYPEIYAAVETACEVLREWLHPQKISEVDVGFIAMHFAAAAERIQEDAEKIAVAVVCPLGIGGSKMLASGLMRSFHNIEIRKMISAFSIESDQLRKEGIDLIITTSELHTDFPYICVSKVLQAQDKLKIQNKIEAINRNRLKQKTRGQKDLSGFVDLDDIQKVSLIGTEISEILQNFMITSHSSVGDMQDLQSRAAAMFTDDPYAQKAIADGFLRREQLGDTFIPEMQICLLHCRTNVLSHSRFGFIRLEHPLQVEKGQLYGAVVMAVPEKDDSCLEPVGRLSALLIEDQRFLQALQSGDTSAGVALAERALVKYYQKELKKRIGDEKL